MAKRINQLEETNIIADDNVFAMDSATEAGKTFKLTFNNLKKELNKNFNLYIVNTSCTQTTWYRVWSDGWCELGGFVKATASNLQLKILLHIPFKNTDYFILVTRQNPSDCGSPVASSNVTLYSKTKEYFVVRTVCGAGHTLIYWEAKGKIDL